MQRRTYTIPTFLHTQTLSDPYGHMSTQQHWHVFIPEATPTTHSYSPPRVRVHSFKTRHICRSLVWFQKASRCPFNSPKPQASPNLPLGILAGPSAMPEPL